MAYEPQFPGREYNDSYLYNELQRIATEMYRPSFLQLEVLSIAPDRPVPGMVACADGIGWDPGAGAGLYLYLGGAWSKL